MIVAVTGGARGIGRASAEAFAREGSSVAIGDVDGLVDTELVAGLKVPGFVRATSPEDVARAILRAVRRNRFETSVPRAMGGASWLSSLFPRRVVEVAGRAVGAERALFEHDRAARRAYEQRVRQEAR